MGQGFYTITIMEPDKEKAGGVEPGEVVLPTPSAPNASADQPSRQDGGTGEEEEPTSSAPADEAAVSLGSRKSMSPLVEIARLNKSISSAPAGQSLLLRNDGASESNGTSRLSFSPCSLVYIPLAPDAAKGEPNQDGGGGEGASPSVPRRGRGRPRKHPLVSPANQTADDAAALDESMDAGEGGSPDKTEEEGDSPVLVKRGRGRPPKKRPLRESDWARGSPPARAKETTPKSQGSRPTREAWKSPDKARATRTVLSPDTAQARGTGSGKRPLTRGALGKDFPSAKRRSWIDVEKELGLD